MPKLQAWLQNEPVRAYLYGLVAPVLALLVALGVITDSVATSIAALAGSALLVPAGALLRRRVVPETRSPRADVDGNVWHPVPGTGNWSYGGTESEYIAWPTEEPSNV